MEEKIPWPPFWPLASARDYLLKSFFLFYSVTKTEPIPFMIAFRLFWKVRFIKSIALLFFIIVVSKVIQMHWTHLVLFLLTHKVCKRVIVTKFCKKSWFFNCIQIYKVVETSPSYFGCGQVIYRKMEGSSLALESSSLTIFSFLLSMSLHFCVFFSCLINIVQLVSVLTK